MATSKFGAAFQAARKAGKKVFSFGGKSYSTKQEKTVKTPDKGPVPSSRPKSAKTGTKRGRSGKGGGIATISDVAGKIASEKKYTNDDIRSARKKKK